MNRSVALALGLALVCSAPGVAQEQPVQEFIQVITVTVRPSAVTEYEDYVKKVVAAFNKLNSAPHSVYVHQPALGGPGYTYEIVIPFNKWSELDAFGAVPQLLGRAYGEPQGAAILKAGRAAVERSETAAYRVLRNLSSARVTPAAFVQVITTEVEPEMASMYEMYLTKLKAAQDQTPGAPTTLRYVSALGRAATYVTALFFNKWAERDSLPAAGDALRKAYGEGEARHLTEASLRAIRSRTFHVSAFRPDLSRVPAAPSQ